MILTSNLSFALTAQQAKDFTCDSIININGKRIQDSISSGYCFSNYYRGNAEKLCSETVFKYFKKRQYKIIMNNEKNDNEGISISWCD